MSPLFLFAAVAVGLPLLFHLLNLKKPRRVAFSTLAFFKELQKTTIRRIRIKKLLLLLLRALAIACLAMVLARPFLTSGSWSGSAAQSPALVAVLIDNSISMDQVGRDGPLLDQAKAIAKKIESSTKENDRFLVQVTNGEALYPAVVGHTQFLNRISELDISKGGSFVEQRVMELQELLKEAPYQQKKIFIISDLQRHVQEAVPKEWGEGISSNVIRLDGAAAQNSSITDVQSATNMVSAGLPLVLSVTVENLSTVPVTNQFVSIEFNDKPAGEYVLAMEGGSSTTVDFEVIPGTGEDNRGVIRIEGDEFTADNEFFFAIDVPSSRKVLWIKDNGTYKADIDYTGLLMEAAAENDIQFSYDVAGTESLDDPDFSEYDAILLDGISQIPAFAFERLADYVQRGGGLVFLPSEHGDIVNYNRFLQQFNIGSFEGIIGEYGSFKSIARVNQIEYDHPLFGGLFEAKEADEITVEQPDVFYYYRLDPSMSSGGFTLMRLNTGDPLIREKRFGSGKVITAAIGNDPAWSNFALKSLYAPFFYQTMMYASSTEKGGLAVHELGSVFRNTVSMNAADLQLSTKDGIVVPDIRIGSAGTEIRYNGEEWTPGYITITDGEQEQSLALNLPPYESPRFNDAQEESIGLENTLLVEASDLSENQLETKLRESGFGIEIWSWFMWAGMFFLVAEVLVSVFYKAEAIEQK